MLEKLKTKKIYLTLMILVTLALLSVGTYALMVWTSEENTELTFRIGDVAEVTFAAPTNEVNISNMGPVFDYEKDGEIVEFSITNIGEDPVVVNVDFNSNDSEFIKTYADNVKYALMVSTDNVNFKKISEGNFFDFVDFVEKDGTKYEEWLDHITIISDYELKEKNYFRLIFYIDANEKNDTDIQGKNFSGTINVTTKLDLAIVTLEKLNLTSSIKTDTPDFSKTSCSSGCEEATVGIYSIEDNLGTSYYFRGDVENNYVKFANNNWRIIRINGDGTVRMILDSPVGTATLGATVSNSIPNKAVGYMYSNSSDAGNLQYSNSIDGGAKALLEGTSSSDGWYYTNIVDSGNHDYVADAIYCNDRGVPSTTCNENYSGNDWCSHNFPFYNRQTQPILTCSEENDRFTSGIKIKNVTGNDNLKYPVGLITADEIVLAGIPAGKENEKTYLPEYDFLTMTPVSYYSFGLSYIGEFIKGDGSPVGANYLCTSSVDCENSSGNIIPVISLKADALKYSATSNGSMEYPFTVTGEQ